jgi:hypothetical protein
MNSELTEKEVRRATLFKIASKIPWHKAKILKTSAMKTSN